MLEGLSIRTNSYGIPILRLHYSAHPDRNEQWVQQEKPKYSEAMWQQEMEIDDSAAGGERLLRYLLERRWKEIVITDPNWEADPGWAYGNGLDYGKAHPCALVACAMDFSGTRYALCEHYRSGSDMTPARHMPWIKEMRLPCVENGANPLALAKAAGTWYDSSMGYKNVAGEERFTSYVELFRKAGMPNMREGLRGPAMDKRIADEIIDAWNQPDPTFKIVCRIRDFPVDIGSLKKREGTYAQGCPNLLWELANLRRKQFSAVREETVGPSEALMDRDNDAFDALCYWWTGTRIAPQISHERKWEQRLANLRGESGRELDINWKVLLRQKFDREMAPKQIPWR